MPKIGHNYGAPSLFFVKGSVWQRNGVNGQEDAHYRRMLPQNVKYNFDLVNRKLLQVFGNCACSAIWQLPYFNFIENSVLPKITCK